MDMIVLIWFVGLGGLCGMVGLDHRRTSEDLVQTAVALVVSCGLIAAMAAVAKRRESGDWLGLSVRGWLSYPALAYIGGLACVLIYKFAF